VVSFTPRLLNPRERSLRYPVDRRWVGPRAGLDDMETWKFLLLLGLELWPLGCPARSQSLYLLRCPGSSSQTGSESVYDWRFTANRFILAPSPLRITIRDFFLQLNPCGHSLYVAPSLTRGRDCLLWTGFAFVKCTYRTYSMLLKILAFALYTSLCQYRLCKSDHAYLTYIILQRQISHLNSRKIDRRQV
jgi:hypothetical protein